MSIDILLDSQDKVKEFVNAAQTLPQNIYLKSGKYNVDGKSILGIFSLDLSKPITVNLKGIVTDAFAEVIGRFKVKYEV